MTDQNPVLMSAVRTLPFLLILAGAVLLIARSRLRGDKGLRKYALVLGIGMVAAGLALPGLQPRLGVEWIACEPGLLEGSSLRGRPVLIDFYADWCVPCHEMERTTYRDARVMEALKEVYAVKADMTRMRDPRTRELISRFALDGVPTILFLDAGGREIPELRLNGYVSADSLLMTLANPMLWRQPAEGEISTAATASGRQNP